MDKSNILLTNLEFCGTQMNNIRKKLSLWFLNSPHDIKIGTFKVFGIKLEYFWLIYASKK